ncbi:MAG: hypothetical protein A3A94_01885 [Candidatus Portnoybacteria bacterium RIFCSPLOWO2_01_FULL_43_11]|uniref:Uncharacterized protein n=1 Tax=Candidatus Portnoybacteria bacterium RIFCSPLOWO2_01_FULL_43_11 TaxID=1802000 RepID=A0A1G2FLT6_9BACT|nr:MAG: hypothetical protein A3A94_01885 [Candidatus Portnoybacteria bacterium RIFCSPLOWO2_01_FULL_43_11]
MLKLMSNIIQADGSSLSLPAHGRAGARATSLLAAHFARQNTKFGGGGKTRAGKNSFPPAPFLFARPSLKVFQNSAFGFSLKKVRISFRVRSQIVCCEFVASALRASAGRLYSICQDFLGSIATFCESKTRFAVAKQRINEIYKPILLFPPLAESKAIIFNSPKAI